MTMPRRSSRRMLLKAALLLACGAYACILPLHAQTGTALTPTPRDAEGPFYKPGSPRRASLAEPDAPGTRLVVTGRVLSTDGTPIKGARLDFWQTDAEGDYDNDGFRFRGHQFTDGAGRYRLETVVPGAYPRRTRHVHVKVHAPDHRPLTTQLYFPDEPRSRADFLYKSELQMQVRDAAGGKEGSFDFVLAQR